jgi:hypothetical protein
MAMPAFNQADLALGQEWLFALDAWIDRHGLCGWDPFDVKQHRWIRAAQGNYLTRKATTLVCDVFPNASRRVLGIARTENPKAHALAALGKMRLYEMTGEGVYLEAARGHLAWLRAHATPGFSGLCWGYPFHIRAKGLETPAGTPILVISAIAGEAFLRAYALGGEEGDRGAARSVAEFMLRDLPRMAEEDGTYCFAYTPGDRRRVHNANLLAAQHLFRTGQVCGESGLQAAAEPALQFTLRRQHATGAWWYGEWRAGEPYERGILHMIDHHHTGFVLRALHAIYGVTGREEVFKALDRGFHYYKRHLFTGAYNMPINGYGHWPVDIHACAEAILCPSVLAPDILAARGMAALSLRWTYWYLRDPETMVPWYRRYPFFTSKLVCPRWGVAWMYWALAEYLHNATRV